MADFFSRYYKTETVEVDGKRSLAQRLTGTPKTFPDQIEHTLVGDETLEALAARYYGREAFWWRIADANPNTFPLDWKPGDKLVIPPLRAATRTPRR
jgi:nucleoid-associated protein YgaU